jgi:hypothetical protein
MRGNLCGFADRGGDASPSNRGQRKIAIAFDDETSISYAQGFLDLIPLKAHDHFVSYTLILDAIFIQKLFRVFTVNAAAQGIHFNRWHIPSFLRRLPLS